MLSDFHQMAAAEKATTITDNHASIYIYNMHNMIHTTHVLCIRLRHSCEENQENSTSHSTRCISSNTSQTFQNQAANCVQAVIMKLRSDPAAPNPAQNGIPPKS